MKAGTRSRVLSLHKSDTHRARGLHIYDATCLEQQVTYPPKKIPPTPPNNLAPHRRPYGAHSRLRHAGDQTGTPSTARVCRAKERIAQAAQHAACATALFTTRAYSVARASWPTWGALYSGLQFLKCRFVVFGFFVHTGHQRRLQQRLPLRRGNGANLAAGGST